DPGHDHQRVDLPGPDAGDGFGQLIDLGLDAGIVRRTFGLLDPVVGGEHADALGRVLGDGGAGAGVADEGHAGVGVGLLEVHGGQGGAGVPRPVAALVDPAALGVLEQADVGRLEGLVGHALAG